MSQSLWCNTDDEVLEVVDFWDKVVTCASRKQIHENKLMHRAVHVFVFDLGGSLFVQRRSAKKDTHPLKLDSSAAGHVDPGETYLQAALRELHEELGIRSDLKEVLRLSPSRDTDYEHIVLYETFTDVSPIINADEITEGYFMPPDEISKRIRQDPQSFVPSFRCLWKSYLDNKS